LDESDIELLPVNDEALKDLKDEFEKDLELNDLVV